jgi:hypothetical protein
MMVCTDSNMPHVSCKAVQPGKIDVQDNRLVRPLQGKIQGFFTVTGQLDDQNSHALGRQ